MLAIATTSTLAFKHPEGSPDGLYVHDVDANGTVSVTYIGISNITVPHGRRSDTNASSTGPVELKSTGPACGGGVGNADDMADAENALADEFGDGITFQGKSVSYTYSSAVAFVCNYGNGQTVTSGQYLGYISSVDAYCGSDVAGWYSYPSSKATYGRTLSGENFC